MYRNSRILVFSGFSLRFIDLKYQKNSSVWYDISKEDHLEDLEQSSYIWDIAIGVSSVLHMEKIRYEIAAGIYC